MNKDIVTIHLRRLDADWNRYFEHLAKVDPHTATPEMFADLQAAAADIDDTRRRMSDSLKSFVEVCGVTFGNAQELLERDRLIAERLSAAISEAEPEPAPAKIPTQTASAAIPLARWLEWLLVLAFISGFLAGALMFGT